MKCNCIKDHVKQKSFPSATYTIWLKVCGHLTIKPICGPSPNYCHQLGSTKLYWMSLYAATLVSPSLELRALAKHVPV